MELIPTSQLVSIVPVNNASVSATEDAYSNRLAHWRAWWKSRSHRWPSAGMLARRMHGAASTVRSWARGDSTPTDTTLATLERLSAAYGYQPPHSGS